MYAGGMTQEGGGNDDTGELLANGIDLLRSRERRAYRTHLRVCLFLT